METAANLNSIFSSLNNYGIDKSFLRKVILPDWWSEDILSSKAGYFQTLSIIAKNLNLNVSDLIDHPDNLIPVNRLPIKFKKAANVEINSKGLWPNTLASKISGLVNESFSIPPQEIISDILELRKTFLTKYNSIELSSILDFLWQNGVPVIFISQFPRDVHKMDGMVIKSADRNIILLSKNRRHNAWAIFILLHELGHIINKHLNDNESIIYDVDIETEIDDEEKQANDSALTFLSGSINHNLLEGHFTTGFKLAVNCQKIAADLQIDPGVIALNFAYRYKNFPLAQQVLKILDPKADAISLIKNKMKSYLQLTNLTEENLEFFLKVTALEGE